MSGTFDGNALRVYVWWPDKSYGQYVGSFDSGGNLSGITKEPSTKQESDGL